MQMNRSVCKMLLTLANLGLDLSTNGFCKPQEQEEGSDEGEGEGTGMGQGQGREDVSEEIENEGQMEGLQGEENKDPQVSFPSFYDAGRGCASNPWFAAKARPPKQGHRNGAGERGLGARCYIF